MQGFVSSSYPSAALSVLLNLGASSTIQSPRGLFKVALLVLKKFWL